MTALFISDLHLDNKRPHITEAFFAFLDNEASGTDSLYILGDLFDAWIGDDDDSPLANNVSAQLTALKKKGTNIYFQHGNRDFLLGKDYADRCGMELLPELHKTEIDGVECILVHGDQLCTDDIEYQNFRRKVREPGWRDEVLRKSLDERRLMAQALREQSQEASSLKAEDIMDVNPDAVSQTFEQQGCRLLIHGHTHRPNRHKIEVSSLGVCERIVLGDWDKALWFLKIDLESVKMIKTTINK